MRDKTTLKDKDESNLLRSTKVPIDPSRRDTKPLRSTSDIAAEIAGYIRQVAPPDVLYSLSGEGDSDFRKYREKPSLFAREVLGVTLSDQQENICKLVLDHRFVVVEAGHGTGKSYLSSILGIWWLCVHDTAILLTSAPTANQVNKILWQVMRSFKNKSNVKIPGEIFLTPRWDIAPDRFGIGLSPRKTSDVDVASLQGYHNRFLLVLLDEGAGLSVPLWRAATSLVTSEGNRLLAIGNPIACSGPFFDATKSPIYRSARIDCLSHPNVVQHKEIIPGAVSWQWVDERVQEWAHPVSTQGPKSFFWEGKWYDPLPVFESRVLGRPPDESEDQLIPLAWIEDAMRPIEQVINTSGERIIGLDVARHGEAESCMTFRVGDVIQWIRRQRGNDITQTAHWLMNEMVDNDVEQAYVDEIGVGGGVVDIALNGGYLVTGVNVSRPAVEKTRFFNQRTETAWVVREKLRKGEMILPFDEKLEGDLVSVRYEFDSLGRVKVEAKEELVKRLGRSPDSGDSLMISYAGETVGTGGGSGLTENYAEALSRAAAIDERLTTSRWNVNQERIGKSRWRL